MLGRRVFLGRGVVARGVPREVGLPDDQFYPAGTCDRVHAWGDNRRVSGAARRRVLCNRPPGTASTALSWTYRPEWFQRLLARRLAVLRHPGANCVGSWRRSGEGDELTGRRYREDGPSRRSKRSGGDGSTWYRATAASADLAVFARGVAECLGRLCPDAALPGDGLSYGSDEAPRQAAELLAPALASWPEDGVLVIDDYHLVRAVAGRRGVSRLCCSC